MNQRNPALPQPLRGMVKRGVCLQNSGCFFQVENICRHLLEEGISILLVEQNLEMARLLSHRAYVFLNGRLALEILGDDFRKNPQEVGKYLGI